MPQFLVCFFSGVMFLFLCKILSLTLKTLGSKEVARRLIWLQNTKEDGNY